MRRKNTSKSQTNFYSEKKLLFLSTVVLSILAGGCGWENTSATLRSAYIKTQKTVTNTLITIAKFQRDHANRQQKTGKTENKENKKSENKEGLTARPAGAPRLEDRFPSRLRPEQEENLSPDKVQQVTKGTTRSEASKEMHLPPRTTMTLEELRQRIRNIEQERISSKNPSERRRLATELRELERILFTYQKEETIIEEMTQLRRRLRKLQKDLLEIQQTSR